MAGIQKLILVTLSLFSLGRISIAADGDTDSLRRDLVYTRTTNPTSHVILPASCFNSQSDFATYFAYNYPWGNTHNGAARMDAAHVSLSGSQLTLTAEYVTGQPPAGSLAINYLSGTVYGKQSYTVGINGGFDFSFQTQAPIALGTWPAFWLTAVQGWPPEIDIAEWKGDGKISFNTYDTSSVVASLDVTYANPGGWHEVKAELRDENGSDVSIAFYLDGVLQTTQSGKGFVNRAMWLILDLQMEGSSGSPGPTGKTTWSIRNLEVLSYN